MATRSRIGFETASGAVTHIYCHFDGYIEGVGLALIEEHNDVNKAHSLVSGGACRSILSRVVDGPREVVRFSATESHRPLSRPRTPSPPSFFGLEAKWSKNRKTYKQDGAEWYEEYQYLWDSRKACWLWRRTSSNENWKRLDTAVRNIKPQENR